LRIQQLKSEGATGKALKEFASDPEVKKMVASDEIASRKKQVSTKIGTGNKSLADMQKLHAELAKYGDDHELMAVVGFLPEEIAGHRKQLLAECAKAQKALAERNNTELMRVKATVGKPVPGRRSVQVVA
jgi:hypothetical protein